MGTVYVYSQSGRAYKTTHLIQTLQKMQRNGEGQVPVMIASVTDPYHYETTLVPVLIDGLSANGHYELQTIKVKVYAHPIKTVDEWLNNTEEAK